MRPSCQTLTAFDMSKNTPRTSYPSSNDAYIPWVVDKTWLIRESPGLKPDWFVEIRWFEWNKVKSNVSLIKVRSADRLLEIVCHFFHELEQHLLFSIVVEKSHFLNINSKGVHIHGPHNFNIRMHILSWLCAFSESKFWSIFRMSSLEKVILDKNTSVLSKSSDGRLPTLLLQSTVYQKRVK